jgi:hypothetical protein
MWRGGGDGVGVVSPVPDVLEVETYGLDGVSYFRALQAI